MAHVAIVELALGARPELVDFLTPICKVFCTEAGITSADLGLQVLGGYGYLTEYRVSQTWRDARITSIYEGANGIHAAGLVTRGLRAQGGAGADAFEGLIGELRQTDELQNLTQAWKIARATVEVADDPTLFGSEFMALTSELFFRAVWVRMSEVAQQSGDAARIDRLAARVARRPLPVALPF
jgi:hypothetical protein